MVQQKVGISGNVLKWIAIASMLIDHIAAVVLLRVILAQLEQSGVLNQEGYDLYNLMRGIGRIAFPIFCFLLVEGFIHTRNKGRYGLRLGVFALLSEVPFDLAFSGSVWDGRYQNVFLTLLIAFLTLIAVETIQKAMIQQQDNDVLAWKQGIAWFLKLSAIAAGAVVAEICHTDYGAKGILCIAVLYFLRNVRMLQSACGCISFFWDGAAPLAFIPIAFYNGTRGRQFKYVFYLFYPIHLLLLYLICVYMGIHGFSVV